jgi:hypothetical protein
MQAAMGKMGGMAGRAGMAGGAAGGLDPTAAADAAVLAKTLRNAFSAVKSATLGPAQMVQATYIALLVLLLLFIVHQVIPHHFEHAKRAQR